MYRIVHLATRLWSCDCLPVQLGPLTGIVSAVASAVKTFLSPLPWSLTWTRPIVFVQMLNKTGCTMVDTDSFSTVVDSYFTPAPSEGLIKSLCEQNGGMNLYLCLLLPVCSGWHGEPVWCQVVTWAGRESENCASLLLQEPIRTLHHLHTSGLSHRYHR